jgi:glutamate dehydrogenase/leucine dehydrogenase
VAPGANVPYGPGAVEVLHGRGIVAVPDFVANSGGVHLYESVGQDDEPEAALEVIEAAVRDAVARTLATSADVGISPSAAALRDACNYLSEATGASPEALDELFGR